MNFLVERAKAALDAGLLKKTSGLIQDLVLLKMKHKTLNFCKAWMLFVSLDTSLFGISRKRTVDYLLGGGTAALERDMGTAALSAWGKLLKGLSNRPRA